MVIDLAPMICLWSGFMNIGIDSGLFKKISKYLIKVIKPIFPDLSKESESISLISMNIIMNMFGVSNAATPIGLKAMQALKKENGNKTIASRSMITFIVINTASVTLIPTTVIALRNNIGDSNANLIIFPTLIVTFSSLIIALIVDRLFYYIWR